MYAPPGRDRAGPGEVPAHRDHRPRGVRRLDHADRREGRDQRSTATTAGPSPTPARPRAGSSSTPSRRTPPRCSACRAGPSPPTRACRPGKKLKSALSSFDDAVRGLGPAERADHRPPGSAASAGILVVLRDPAHLVPRLRQPGRHRGARADPRAVRGRCLRAAATGLEHPAHRRRPGALVADRWLPAGAGDTVERRSASTSPGARSSTRRTSRGRWRSASPTSGPRSTASRPARSRRLPYYASSYGYTGGSFASAMSDDFNSSTVNSAISAYQATQSSSSSSGGGGGFSGGGGGGGGGGGSW